MRFLISLILVISFAQCSKYEKEFEKLSLKQLNVLKHIMSIGSEFDLSYTLGAIAWQESNLGKYNFNWNFAKNKTNFIHSMDCGVFHNNTRTVAKRLNLGSHNKANMTIICQKLMNDFEFSVSNTMAEINTWRKVHGSESWMKIWSSYNGGHKGNSNYAKAIQSRIKVLFRHKNFLLGGNFE